MIPIFFVKYLPFGFNGIAIPPLFILIRIDESRSVDSERILISHEKIHFEQAKRMFYLLFYFRYIFQLIFIGYKTMPLEMEARFKAGEKDIIR